MDVSTPNASTPQWVEPIGSESYEIGKRLGAGHAVTVYAAVRQRDRQPVAVKFSNDDVSRGSLEEEARLLKRWTDLEKQRRAEGERWHYTPTFCAMRLDQKPCLVVEKVEGYTLASIDERLCAQWNMSREWVALKVGMQLAHVFTFLHGESFHLAYSDLKDDSILWQPDLNAPQNGHIMVLDWNLLYDLQTVADRNVLIAQDLERLNRLVYWLAVGRTLGGYGAVTYDDLERAGGEGWKSLSYGCQELLARALSPLEEHRYHTAQDLHGAYAEIADIWDTTVSHGQFSGQLRNLDQQPLLEETRQWRIACWHSIGLLAHKSEASEARKQEAIEKLHGTQDILGVRSHFQAGRKDAEVLVQKLIDAGRHVLEAKRWQVLFRGVNWEQLSLQDPVREEMIQAMDRLNEGDHEQAEGFLDALSRSHPTWQLDALQQECKFVRTMKAARRKVGPQSEEPLYSQAQEILRTLANRDGEYAKELRRRFGDPQLALQEMRKDRDKREVAAMLQKATAADDISAARSGFLRALAEGAAPSEVIQAIEGRLLTALRGPEPDLRQEPLALASLAMEDPRLTELAYLWQLVRPLAAIQHTLATGKQGELHPILNLLVDRAELAQAASGASVGKRSSEAAQRLLAIARNIAEDSQKWLQGAVAASGDDVLLQILSEGDAFVPKDRQLVEEERQDRARKLEESKRKLERERLEIRAESLSYWQEVSRFAILQTEAALIRRYLDEFERIIGSQSQGDADYENIRHKLQDALQRAESSHAPAEAVRRLSDELSSATPDYERIIKELVDLQAAGITDLTLGTRVNDLLRRAREGQRKVLEIRPKKDEILKIKALCQQVHAIHGSLDMRDLLKRGISLADESLKIGADQEVSDLRRWLASALAELPAARPATEPLPAGAAQRGQNSDQYASDSGEADYDLRSAWIRLRPFMITGMISLLLGIVIGFNIYQPLRAAESMFWSLSETPVPSVTSTALPPLPSPTKTLLENKTATDVIVLPSKTMVPPTQTPTAQPPTATPTATPVPPTDSPLKEGQACLSADGVKEAAKFLGVSEERILTHKVVIAGEGVSLLKPARGKLGTEVWPVSGTGSITSTGPCEPDPLPSWPDMGQNPTSAGPGDLALVVYRQDGTLAGVIGLEQLKPGSIAVFPGGWYRYQEGGKNLYFRYQP